MSLEGEIEKSIRDIDEDNYNIVFDNSIKNRNDLYYKSFMFANTVNVTKSLEEVMTLQKKIYAKLLEDNKKEEKYVILDIKKSEMSFKKEILEAIRNHPVESIQFMSIILIVFSLFAVLINLFSSKYLISPYMILITAFHGIFIYLMTYIELFNKFKDKVK